MCARRFLIAVFILTLLAVAGGFAVYQWGAQMLVRQATPKGHFEAPPRSSGPDYVDAANWIARPDLADDPSRWLPDGFVEEPGNRPAAVFFIHPTTYLERDRWNAELEDRGSQDRAALFVRSQASAFNAVGEVWAPRYRQAAYGAFLLDSEDAQKALDLAYFDVQRAFDEFLRGFPAQRPVILAGHSQGSLHLLRLIQERREDLRGRLVAAYVVGWPIAAGADLPALAFPDCRQRDDSGCVLSWMTFAEPANPNLILSDWRGRKGLTGRERSGQATVCVNPINGTDGTVAPATDNPGTLVPNVDFTSATLLEGAVGARCEKGLLILDGEIPPIGPYVLPGNNYHVYDYALFWGAIRQDAARRLASWRR